MCSKNMVSAGLDELHAVEISTALGTKRRRHARQRAHVHDQGQDKEMFVCLLFVCLFACCVKVSHRVFSI